MDTEAIEQEYLSQLNQIKDETKKDVNSAFDEAIRAIIFIPLLSVLFNRTEKKPFTFRRYPVINKEANQVLSTFRNKITETIQSGIKKSWEVGNFKNDKIVNEFYAKLKGSPEIPAKFKQRNLQSLDSFITRSKDGMNLSKRVWNLTDEFKKELEIQIGQGITEKLTPTQLSKRIKKYLNNPQTAEKGKGLELLKQVHPGPGVYRSANKNALRLAGNELQMAYRQSNWERWQQQDFIIGQYIRISAAHKITDICDDVQGPYPKWFKFTGWHVSCTCICIAITNKNYDGTNDNQITKLPENFNKWVAENADRIKTWKSKPYFIRDNKKAVEKIIKKAGK